LKAAFLKASQSAGVGAVSADRQSAGHKKFLDLRLAQDLARLKSELLQWVFGLLIVQTGMTAVLFKLLH
jgi:hypothetical protein